MSNSPAYVLGQSERAARRLAIQDAHFAQPSELLLDALAIRPADCVVELGCGPGGLSRRILKRLGDGGVLVAVDSAPGLLEQAKQALAGAGTAKFLPILADVSTPGSWLDGADVVVGRAVLHHLPMAELLLGKLRAVLRPGVRIGFIEPEFRAPLARLGHLQATTNPEFAPLAVWATAINQLYLARRISPSVGATLGTALALAGYHNVQATWTDFPSDETVIENMVMFYDEVRDVLGSLGILSSAEIDAQKAALLALPTTGLPPVWGVHRVTAEV